MATYIVEIQGFQINGKFLSKELAIINLYDCCCKIHVLFNFSFDLENLSVPVQKQINWVTKNLHGLEWYTPLNENVQPYEKFVNILHQYLKNVEQIFVKGEMKKISLSIFST